MRTSEKLSRIEKLITGIDSSLKITKQVDDCIEYLPDDYIIVHGDIASIRVYIEQGGCHSFINAFLFINHKYVYDMTPSPSSEFGYEFKVDVPEFTPALLSDDTHWEEKLTGYIEDAKRFLVTDKELFCRIDTVYYDDGSGSRKSYNGKTYDRYRVHDDDFYTDSHVKKTRRTLLPVITDEDKFDPDFLDDDYLRDSERERELVDKIIRYGEAGLKDVTETE